LAGRAFFHRYSRQKRPGPRIPPEEARKTSAPSKAIARRVRGASLRARRPERRARPPATWSAISRNTDRFLGSTSARFISRLVFIARRSTFRVFSGKKDTKTQVGRRLSIGCCRGAPAPVGFQAFAACGEEYRGILALNVKIVYKKGMMATGPAARHAPSAAPKSPGEEDNRNIRKWVGKGAGTHLILRLA